MKDGKVWYETWISDIEQHMQIRWRVKDTINYKLAGIKIIIVKFRL